MKVALEFAQDLFLSIHFEELDSGSASKDEVLQLTVKFKVLKDNLRVQ